MRPILLLLLSVASASTGQVLFKKGVLITGEVTLKNSVIGELLKLLFQPVVFSGLILYVISTVLWLIALSKTTLNFAYPFTALTFALVMLSSRFIFMESIPLLRYFGIGLIVLGVLLSSVAKG
jgi:multidrug transporter EmrE-like cation transporter